MSWYAAHIVMCINVRQGNQEVFPAHENIVLIEADSAAQAKIKAIDRGENDAALEDESLMLDGMPAKLVFVGVRKIVDCVDPDSRPDDGTEVSYLHLEFTDAKALLQFVQGNSELVDKID